MASVAAARTASKLLSNESFDMAMLGLGGFALYEFWPLIRPFFEIGKGTLGVATGLADAGGKVVTDGLKDLGKLAGADGDDAEDTGVGIVENVAISQIPIIGPVLSFMGIGEKKKETDLQKRIDDYEQKNGISIISDDGAARDCWNNVIEGKMSFKDALSKHMRVMKNTYPDLKYTASINGLKTSTTLSFSDDVKIWDALQGVAYIVQRHQSDAWTRPVDDGERQGFICDALIAEAIPSPAYFNSYDSEKNLIIYNDVEMTYIEPRWRFQPNPDSITAARR
jgi:hypothetical protein